MMAAGLSSFAWAEGHLLVWLLVERRCLFVRELLTLVLRLVELEVGQARRRHHLVFLLVVLVKSAKLHWHAAGGMVFLAVRRYR